MKTINLNFSNQHLEVWYEIVGQHKVSVKKALCDSVDILPKMDKNKLDALKKKINQIEF